MEKFKTFNDSATENGTKIETLDTSFLSDFGNYMQQSVLQSDHNTLMAVESASQIFINR